MDGCCRRLALASRLQHAGESLMRSGHWLETTNDAVAECALKTLEKQALEAEAVAAAAHRETRGPGLRAPPAGVDGADPLTEMGITGVLVDLDGTVYTPSGLIPGADDFYAHLRRRKIPYCFVSNTGAKFHRHVQKKLANANGSFYFRHVEVESEKIMTAAEVQIDWMLANLPDNAKVFVVAGEEPGLLLPKIDARLRKNTLPWWRESLEARGAAKVAKWDVKTSLTESEAAAWSAVASASKRDCVFVAFFSDGRISDSVDPSTGELGYSDWSFDVIKKTSYLLAHGATLIATAEDAYNPAAYDPRFPGHCLTLPGPGMFTAMFKKLMYPLGRDKLVVCGKGGRSGLMMKAAMRRLVQQGHDGDASKVLMIGDRFDTDVAAGVYAGTRTCLVESGAHHRSLQPFYDRFPADYACATVGDLVPAAGRTPADYASKKRYLLADAAAPPKLTRERAARRCSGTKLTTQKQRWFASFFGPDEANTSQSSEEDDDDDDDDNSSSSSSSKKKKRRPLWRHETMQLSRSDSPRPSRLAPPPPPLERALSASPIVVSASFGGEESPFEDDESPFFVHEATVDDELRTYTLRRGRIHGKALALDRKGEDQDELAFLLNKFHDAHRDASGKISAVAVKRALLTLGVQLTDARMAAIVADNKNSTAFSLPQFFGVARRCLDDTDLNFERNPVLFGSTPVVHARKHFDDHADLKKITPKTYNKGRASRYFAKDDDATLPPVASAIDLSEWDKPTW